MGSEIEQLRDHLLTGLDERARRVQTLEAYYTGDHPQPKPPGKLDPAAFREAVAAWRALTRLGVTNWVKLVADAPANRIAVTGFRRRRRLADLAAQPPGRRPGAGARQRAADRSVGGPGVGRR